MIKTVAFVLVGGVTLSLINIAVSPILHMIGKGELDGLFTGVCMVGMLALFLVGVFAVLHGICDITGLTNSIGLFKDFYTPSSLDKLGW